MACADFLEEGSPDSTPKSSPKKSVDRSQSLANEAEEGIDPKQISIECEGGPDRLKVKDRPSSPAAELVGCAADLTASEVQAELAAIDREHGGESPPRKKTR